MKFIRKIFKTIRMNLTGILYFKKVYGRKKDKLLYQCIPYNKNENPILVPYKEKENKFSKVKEPLYIVYRKENEKYGIIFLKISGKKIRGNTQLISIQDVSAKDLERAVLRKLQS